MRTGVWRNRDQLPEEAGTPAPARFCVVNARPTYSACVATQRCISPLLSPLLLAHPSESFARHVRAFLFRGAMPFQLSYEAERRWVLVMHQIVKDRIAHQQASYERHQTDQGQKDNGQG